MIVRALTNFEYPKERNVRDRIRASAVHPYPGDRGPIVQVVEGAVFDCPDDLLDSLLARGAIEAAVGEEVTTDG